MVSLLSQTEHCQVSSYAKCKGWCPYLEGLDELVGDALDDAHLGLGLVVHGPEREGHHAELLGGLRVELPRVLHLEHVRLVGLLVDGDLGVALAALALAGRDQHVDAVDLKKNNRPFNFFHRNKKGYYFLRKQKKGTGVFYLVLLEVVLVVLLPLGL